MTGRRMCTHTRRMENICARMNCECFIIYSPSCSALFHPHHKKLRFLYLSGFVVIGHHKKRFRFRFFWFIGLDSLRISVDWRSSAANWVSGTLISWAASLREASSWLELWMRLCWSVQSTWINWMRRRQRPTWRVDMHTSYFSGVVSCLFVSKTEVRLDGLIAAQTPLDTSVFSSHALTNTLGIILVGCPAFNTFEITVSVRNTFALDEKNFCQ